MGFDCITIYHCRQRLQSKDSITPYNSSIAGDSVILKPRDETPKIRTFVGFQGACVGLVSRPNNIAQQVNLNEIRGFCAICRWQRSGSLDFADMIPVVQKTTLKIPRVCWGACTLAPRRYLSCSDRALTCAVFGCRRFVKEGEELCDQGFGSPNGRLGRYAGPPLADRAQRDISMVW